MTEYHLIGCCNCQPANPAYKKPFLSMTTQEQINEVLYLREQIALLQEKAEAQQTKIEVQQARILELEQIKLILQRR